MLVISAVRTRSFTIPIVGNGIQPSPSSTARRIARSLLPPTQIGGGGFLVGRGRRVLPGGGEWGPGRSPPFSPPPPLLPRGVSLGSAVRAAEAGARAPG